MGLTSTKKAIAKTRKPDTTKLGASINNPGDFSLVNQYFGYRSKEDITNLPSGYLVPGSQNILTTTGGRFGVRKGYSLDGQADATVAGIKSSFDWNRHTGTTVNLRYANGKLQYRYVATAGDKWSGTTFTAGQVYWIDLLTGLTATMYRFTDYWDNAELISLALFVNGTSNVYDWSGAITTLTSSTVNTLTNTGSTWGQLGFLKTGTRSVVINGNTYTYTGGEGTNTLTGVTPDPSGEPVQSVVHQSVRTTANSAITGLPAAFANDLISVLRNQVYIGSLVNNSVYVSKVNNFKDFSFTSPVRVVGEGALLTLDGTPAGFVPQEDVMYITAGKDFWYQTKFTISSDNSKEDFSVTRLKTAPRQAAKSQELVSKIKNSVVFINNEQTFDELGRTVGSDSPVSTGEGGQVIINNNTVTPSATNISDPIKNDFDVYDFTNGHIIYFRNFLYISVPLSGIVLVYNIIKGYWEAPQNLPIGRFAIIGGLLYGHDYNVPQTYQLFTGYNDNGNPIDARAVFSYQNYGTRSQTKDFNELFVEGYISSNSVITFGINFEIDGCLTNLAYDFAGTDSLVCSSGVGSASLGKTSFGKNPLGGLNTQVADGSSLPPKFRIIKVFNRKPFYEVQYTFSSIGIDYQWEILSFGGLVRKTEFGNNAIKK